MLVTPNFCVVIPCYNHGSTVDGVLERLHRYALPCIIVDDGSAAATKEILEDITSQRQEVTLLRLNQNSGKGGAVMAGLKKAAEQGFSHAVQIDADGQHNIEDLPKLLALANQHPEALISGQPQYDDSIPKSRLYGRWLTHIWVWIETLSTQIKDSMCGFRVYPLASTLALLNSQKIGRYMDFDTEVMVRLYWQGVPSYFVPTKVIYPKDGLSHFDAFKDNVRISKMHTRLVLGMLPRIPSLLSRKRHTHWAKQAEIPGLWGMRLMFKIWALLGQRTFSLLLWPVIFTYWLFAKNARHASTSWLKRVKSTAQRKQIALPNPLNSYAHFLRFGHSLLDKIASWRGELKLGKDVFFAPGAEAAFDVKMQRGKLILASHLGDIEVTRALAQLESSKTINALVFTEHAKRFKTLMDELAPQAGLNLIPVTDIGPDTIILLKEKIEQGEWVAIVGDRIAVQPQRGKWRVIWSEFMGAKAPFPQGPFILASLLRCPVLLLFALRQHGQRIIHCERFADPLILPRANRDEALQEVVDRYAERLEHYALLAPLDWFNFFDFWQLPAPTFESPL